MASNDHNDQDTDDSKDEDSDSGFLVVNQIPRIRPIQVTRLNTVEELMNELETYKNVNEQLRTQIFRLNRKVVTSERTFRTERTRIESTQKVELMKKDNNIKEAMVKFEKMRKRNTALLENINEYETTIKVLETNEKALQTKLAAFKDKKKKKLIESESRKTEDNERELRDLKHRLQDLETELEEKNKNIAEKISDNSKVNETLEGMMGQMANFVEASKKMANFVEESKKNDAKRDLKLESVDRNVNNILLEMQRKNLQNDPRGEGTIAKGEIENGRVAGANNEGICAQSISSGRPQTEMSRSTEIRTKFPPITRNRSTSQDKEPWHRGGPTKQK